ncbi:response regulator transcription factor [Coleofasciculus sp. FACHB-64]|nr:response regulator transcription factor [Coleofasciculus sp. FACHB-501]MBD1881020.1 response regulator transcription factor [Coleofasciculus sp. FACHB-T130]MBD1889768.1 response regulator transcription factor [Coleofasciculus sp. FACHB-SPT9]MBD1897758.1 response regulator transcription factor [Coleofasciculus sp. FACHB-129]MBD1900691.1 response regulator transcription factor [Coleofasciculus sp. FACHB-125]MBD2045852.1 response regulator transcription factor [Coleofasciculus sp. FACHB-64]MB
MNFTHSSDTDNSLNQSEASERQQQARIRSQKNLITCQNNHEKRQKALTEQQKLLITQRNSLRKLRKEREKLIRLLASAKTVMDSEGSALQSVLKWGDLHFNPATHEATYAGQPLNLTAKECCLLELFLKKGSCILKRDEILQRLWQPEEMPHEETIKAHIKHLRRKLQAVGAPADLIETVYGVGYRLQNSPPRP